VVEGRKWAWGVWIWCGGCVRGERGWAAVAAGSVIGVYASVTIVTTGGAVGFSAAVHWWSGSCKLRGWGVGAVRAGSVVRG